MAITLQGSPKKLQEAPGPLGMSGGGISASSIRHSPTSDDCLNGFAAAETIKELGRSQGRCHVEFCAQGSGTGVVLPNGQLYLALSAVASHQPAMSVLP